MIYLYSVFAIYVILAAVHIAMACCKDSKGSNTLKICVSILYLVIAVLAFLLNTIDGKLVAGKHFAWIFSALALCFAGDMVMMKRNDERVPLAAPILFLAAHMVFLVYFSVYLYITAVYWVSIRELIIFGAGIIIAVIMVSVKSLDFGRRKAFNFIYTVIGFAMVAKASSMIEFMNTSVSWPTFIGVLFFAASDILSRIEHYGNGGLFTRGTAMVLYYAGMAILPLGIYHV